MVLGVTVVDAGQDETADVHALVFEQLGAAAAQRIDHTAGPRPVIVVAKRGELGPWQRRDELLDAIDVMERVVDVVAGQHRRGGFGFVYDRSDLAQHPLGGAPADVHVGHLDNTEALVDRPGDLVTGHAEPVDCGSSGVSDGQTGDGRD